MNNLKIFNVDNEQQELYFLLELDGGSQVQFNDPPLILTSRTVTLIHSIFSIVIIIIVIIIIITFIFIIFIIFFNAIIFIFIIINSFTFIITNPNQFYQYQLLLLQLFQFHYFHYLLYLHYSHYHHINNQVTFIYLFIFNYNTIIIFN